MVPLRPFTSPFVLIPKFLIEKVTAPSVSAGLRSVKVNAQKKMPANKS